MSSTQLSEYLLEESKVVTVPGDGFGATNNIRFSYAVSTDSIIDGIQLVKEALIKIK